MATFVFRLIAPRPTFALDMTDAEREIMGQHAAYWQPFLESGRMVVFGPVLDGSGSWGLGVVEAEDEAELREFAAGDPAVTTVPSKSERWLPGSFVPPDRAGQRSELHAASDCHDGGGRLVATVQARR